jgi:ankyrin repeat protein
MLTESQGLKNIDALNVKNYQQNLKDRLNKQTQISKISKDDLINTNLKQDPAQLKFINDESKVLLLPNDEVVLGEVTRETQLNLMDLSSYIKIFWDNYYNLKDEPVRQAIDNFVNNYDSNFNKKSTYNPKQIESVIAEAFKAIDRNSIYDLMNLLDNYPILQFSDHQGNTLLHKSVYKNNYSAAKFLIMKGIDISIQNNQNLTALDIAISQKKANIENLLRAAGAKY